MKRQLMNPPSYATASEDMPAKNAAAGQLLSLADIEAAAQVVYQDFAATPQYHWPLLGEHLDAKVWLKHENHTPVGAFKIRGGLTYFDQLAQRSQLPEEVISSTRGNHGQSIGWAARRHGVACTIVVPHGNSAEKNAAMRSLGVTLLEHGDDFQAAREYAMQLARERDAHMVPSFHADLLRGVSTYWWEFLRAVPQLQVAYVPIGLGSGACAAIAAKQALGHGVRIVGVISRHAHYFQRHAQRRRRRGRGSTGGSDTATPHSARASSRSGSDRRQRRYRTLRLHLGRTDCVAHKTQVGATPYERGTKTSSSAVDAYTALCSASYGSVHTLPCGSIISVATKPPAPPVATLGSNSPERS